MKMNVIRFKDSLHLNIKIETFSFSLFLGGIYFSHLFPNLRKFVIKAKLSECVNKLGR